jgi:hypothetical protein
MLEHIGVIAGVEGVAVTEHTGISSKMDAARVHYT